jgi:16S rRNA (guanine527-N7)-methyltransferase
VVSRAVTNLPEFIPLTRNLIAKKMRNAYPNGIWYLKGGDFEEELKEVKTHSEVFEIKNWFSEPFFETKKLVYISAR